MLACRPIKSTCQNERVVSKVTDSTCAFKNHHLFLHRCTRSPACISSAIQRVIIQQKHTNESLHKHVVQQISHVQQCSLQAQIMFVITVRWLHQSPGNICSGKWDSWFPIQTHARTHTNTHSNTTLIATMCMVSYILKRWFCIFLAFSSSAINQKAW